MGTKGLMALWLILLLPWLALFVPMSGMAFDAGPSLAAWLVAIGVWSYPPTIILAFILRRRRDGYAWLPLFSLAFPFAAALLRDALHVSSN